MLRRLLQDLSPSPSSSCGVQASAPSQWLNRWKAAALLASQTGSEKTAAAAVAALPGDLVDRLDGEALPDLVGALALLGPSHFGLRERCLARQAELMLTTQDEERRSARFRLARAWSLAETGGHCGATAAIVGKLGSQPDESRKTFSGMTAARLADMAHLLSCVHKPAVPKGKFHKYYMVYKAFELFDDVPEEDLPIVFTAMLRHRLMTTRDHPTGRRFAEKAFARVASGRLKDQATVEKIFQYFEPYTNLPEELVLPLLEAQFSAHGDAGEEVPDRRLLWLGYFACRLPKVLPQLASCLQQRLQEDTLTLEDGQDCAFAAAILTSSWLPDGSRQALADRVNSRARDIISCNEKSLLTPLLKALLTMAYLSRSFVDPTVVHALLSSQRFFRPHPADPAGSVRLHQAIMFSQIAQYQVTRDVLVHLCAVTSIRLSDEYRGPRLKLWVREWNEEEEKAEQLNPQRRRYAMILDLLQEEFEERGVAVARLNNLQHLDTTELKLDGAHHVVVMDRNFYAGTCFINRAEFQVFCRGVLGQRGVSRVDFFDCKDALGADEGQVVRDYVANILRERSDLRSVS